MWFFLKDTSAATIRAIIEFMYKAAAAVSRVEKVDLTEDDDGDVSLDATLGYVAEYEGSYGEPDLSVSALVAGGATAAAAGGQPGPSQRPLDDTGPPGGVACEICGRLYSRALSLEHHKKVHEGLTTCPVCGVVASRVAHLRRHMEKVHHLSAEHIWSLVPSRRSGAAV
ncbi:longitudinals lacking protein, isoforms A/B/D/L-like [Pollicipes pollicipes]|uniref:longitudinals lacking protein, isoforms A/B/D/L-like n=1 Tax=Pollicipes pollicipes TaxID=41117 RepID=UPI0018856525|nr:longitudinals lacking protein, isoforms A/B/D/L-like [Pollicipes pollicipes]